MQQGLWKNLILALLHIFIQLSSPSKIESTDEESSHRNEFFRRNKNDRRDETRMYEPRIIGGNEAQRGRYPYMVSLTYQYSHVCGGSLIADDMVLSAAHCSGFFDGIEIGRHDLSDDGEQFERYNIESFTNHPGFNGDSSSVGAFDNDYMLVKMYGFSRNNKIQLNSDPSVPSLSDDELYVMGWGVDNVVSKSTSDVLKEVSVNYITNEQCKRKKGMLSGYNTIYSLEDKVTINMLCASDENEDACQGDSGGSIIQKGFLAKDDLQVGVVSWGLSCAHNIFPGVYSRISRRYDWIKTVVCNEAESPPDYFGCPSRPDQAKGSDDELQKVTIQIDLDRFPAETGWLLRSSEEKIKAYIPIGSYKDMKQKSVQAVLQLVPNQSYTFIMLDSYGDGLNFDDSKYRVMRGGSQNSDMLLVAGSKFGRSQHHNFFLPKQIPESDTAADQSTSTDIKTTQQETSPPTQSDSKVEFELTLVIKLDNYPGETGWTITSLEGKTILASKPIGSYDEMNYELQIEKIILPGTKKKNSTFTFTIFDAGGDGICCEKGFGFFQILLGDISDNNILLSGSQFQNFEEFQFVFDQTSEMHLISKHEEEEIENTSQYSACSNRKTTFLIIITFFLFLCF